MEGRLKSLVARLTHARPVDEDEARAALEWLAHRQGKSLSELVHELVAAK